ncbi:MAG: hypothetical protein KA313_07645 [Pseudarcicella sp.]|nr:hypothetical protein [Pseudarcicella sp.]MBP6410953.1 hypothetical protein [Pseudarcicella sp.]
MRINYFFAAFFMVVFMTGCVDTKRVTELSDQIKRLESQVLKERQDNAELSTFRFSLESQFKQKSDQYVKCSEDNKETIETLGEKYNNLVQDFNKIQSSYKQLNSTFESSKENSTRQINELEEKLRLIKLSRTKRK